MSSDQFDAGVDVADMSPPNLVCPAFNGVGGAAVLTPASMSGSAPAHAPAPGGGH
jgi:hypothetical protein